jgi:endonuclease G, mitochondrial
MPLKSADFEFGPTHFVVREGYALEHLSTDKIPLWVCEGVTQDQLHGSAKRRDKFNPDPKLPAGQRAELSDYKGSGFDRGHQAPAGNQVKSQQRKDETFLLSNMAPQVGAFNQQIWAALEDMVRLWVENGNATDVHVLTSGIFYDPAEDNPTTADGLIPFDAIGNGVAVPTHFYKIVLGKKAGVFEAIAFVMENKKVSRPYDFTKYIKPIDWVEERAGLDFFPELPPLDEQRLERTASPLW